MLIVIVSVLIAASAFAEDTSGPVFSGYKVKKHTAVAKSTKAYKKAKEACVSSSNGELKTKKLTECIVNYQKETK